MPLLTIRHTTRYRYNRAVGFGEHRMMFRPCEGYDQRVLGATLTITPEPVELRHAHDVFGNCLQTARFADDADELTFHSCVDLEHSPHPPAQDDGDQRSPATFPVIYSTEDLPDLARSIERAHLDGVGEVDRWARRFVRRDGPIGAVALLSAITRAVHEDFRYNGRLEVGTQTPGETLALRAGSCRDFAVLMIDAARSLGFAARFVSGYLYSAGRAGGAPRVGGGHTHAWVRVFLPHCGWVEFDPTNGIVGSTDLIRVAVARDPRQALPLSGTWRGEAKDYAGMDVSVDVRLN